MSNLAAIYTAIANVTVTASSVTPKAYDTSALPDAIDARVPCRLLLPFGLLGEHGGDFSFATFGSGGLGETNWQVTDLCLWRGASTGTGLKAVAPNMVFYEAAYLEALRANRYLGLDNVEVKGVRLRAGVYEWPSGSAQWFEGVLCIVAISEYL
ncbi:MAG: hypothetical protein WCF84_26715 [Anaerolineae bacterium]